MTGIFPKCPGHTADLRHWIVASQYPEAQGHSNQSHAPSGPSRSQLFGLEPLSQHAQGTAISTTTTPRDESVQHGSHGTHRLASNGPAAHSPAGAVATPVSLNSRSNTNTNRQPAVRLGDQEAADLGTPPVSAEVDLLRRLQSLEHVVASISKTNDTRESYPADGSTGGVTQEWQVIANKSRDWGKNRIPEVTSHEFAVIISCYSEILGRASGNASFQQPEVAQVVAHAAELLRQCKSTASRIKIRRPTRVPSAEMAALLPDRNTADKMANLYFATFESTHRILHVPSFWAEYGKFWQSPNTAPGDLRLKVLLVISTGSSLRDLDEDGDATFRNTELVHQWIHDAELWLAGPLEKDRLTLSALQIHCLAILARQIFSIGSDTVWISMGSLVHTAMQLGLHRDPKNLPSMPCLQAELRRRLWATILDLTAQAALDAGMPPRISPDEFDTGPPANVNDDEMDETTMVLEPHPDEVFTSTSIQIALLASVPLRLRVAKHLSLRTKPNYSDVLDLSMQLTHAVRTCHQRFQRASSATFFHRNLLDYLIRRFIIPLHYPFSNRARQDPQYQHSLALSASTAVALMNPTGADAHFAGLLAIGGGLFREGFRSAMTALGLELLGLVQDQRLDGTLACGAKQRELLKDHAKEFLALALERIRLGETNVKSHMFLEMILAQVEAVEEGANAEERVACAARDSLRTCHELLAARATRQTAPGQVDFAMEMGEGLDAADFGLDWDWDELLPEFMSN